jgi:GxxExxY protein
MENDSLTGKIIGLAIEVHRILGPGLLESAYEECLAYEFSHAGLSFKRQDPLPVIYKGVKLDCGYQIDMICEERVVLELKTVATLMPIHTAQLLTYLKLSKYKTGLLINFNTSVLKGGIKRVVL